MPGSVWAGLRRYGSANDPASAVVNTIALVIAGNQPFYPFFVLAIAGHAGWPAFLTWFSTPLFLAVPAAGRRNREAGAALLCVAGIANTVITNVFLGGASGIPLFYLPCIILCLTVLERRRPWLRAGSASAVGLLAAGLAHSPPRLAAFSPSQLRSLQHLHGFSVLCLTAFMAVLLIRVARRRQAAPDLSPLP